MPTRCLAQLVAPVLILSLLLPPARADRPAIEQALTEMGRAVAAADPDAYLAHVSPSDVVFHAEQSNWAKDLRRIRPASVAFAIGEPPENAEPNGRGRDRVEEFGEKKSRFELVTTWTLAPAEGDGKPIERTVSFPVVFERTDDGRWLYAGEDWLVLQSDEPPARDERFQGVDPDSARAGQPIRRQRGARVKYLPGYEAVAERIVALLPLVREHVDEGFGGEVPRVQEVKLYPTMKHLQASIYLSYTDGLSGWNEPGESIKLLTRPTASTRALRSLLAHEYAHVATFELGPRSNDMPWWVLEGVAELSAERFVGGGKGKDAEAAVVRWHNDDRLTPWADLADFHTVARSLHRHVYKQGQHMMMFISDEFGRDARNQWMREMSDGKTIDQATRAVMRMSFPDLDAKWRQAVKTLAEQAAATRAAKEQERRTNDAAPARVD